MFRSIKDVPLDYPKRFAMLAQVAREAACVPAEKDGRKQIRLMS